MVPDCRRVDHRAATAGDPELKDNLVKAIKFYPSEVASRIIGPTDSLTPRVNAVLLRYEAMVKAAMPGFTKQEWCAIFDANNGTDVFNDEHDTSVQIWANVADSVGLDEKWEIDSAELVRILQGLKKESLIAVQEACVRFWQCHDLPTDEALEQSWARITTNTTADSQ